MIEFVFNFLLVRPHLCVSLYMQNYGSLDSIEPSKFILGNDRNGSDAAMVSEIDRTMKKYADNLLHVLEGISARLTQLETRTCNLESSVDDLKVSIGNNHGSTDGKMRQMENILREVSSSLIFSVSAHLLKILSASGLSAHGEWRKITSSECSLPLMIYA